MPGCDCTEHASETRAEPVQLTEPEARAGDDQGGVPTIRLYRQV